MKKFNKPVGDGAIWFCSRSLPPHAAARVARNALQQRLVRRWRVCRRSLCALSAMSAGVSRALQSVLAAVHSRRRAALCVPHRSHYRCDARRCRCCSTLNDRDADSVGGSVCMQLLTRSGWTPSNDIDSVIVQSALPKLASDLLVGARQRQPSFASSQRDHGRRRASRRRQSAAVHRKRGESGV